MKTGLLTIHRIDRSADPAFAGLASIYTEAHPASERKSIGLLAAMIQRPEYLFLVASEESRVVGFAIVLCFPQSSACLLEYLAIAQDRRSHGLGQSLFTPSGNAPRSRRPLSAHRSRFQSAASRAKPPATPGEKHSTASSAAGRSRDSPTSCPPSRSPRLPRWRCSSTNRPCPHSSGKRIFVNGCSAAMSKSMEERQTTAASIPCSKACPKICALPDHPLARVAGPAMIAERVIDAVGRDHKPAARKRDQHFGPVRRQGIAPISSGKNQRQSHRHQTHHPPAPVAAIAVDQRDGPQRRNHKGQRAVRPLLRRQKVRRNSRNRQHDRRQQAVNHAERRGPDAQPVGRNRQEPASQLFGKLSGWGCFLHGSVRL